MKIEVIHHASIKLIGEKTIYIDPYKIGNEYHDADYIFITHNHYDHYDVESISKVKNQYTKIIVPECLKDEKNDMVVEPNRKYKIDNIEFEVLTSYNIDKEYHPKDKKYVGYNILLENEYYYIMGDTDRTPEIEKIKTDYCFVPIGGTFTMDVDEAADYINLINPKVAIPIHYGMIVGDKNLAQVFKDKVNKNITIEIGGEDV